jgi:GNAT superfamily N-acetyltransferase
MIEYLIRDLSYKELTDFQTRNNIFTDLTEDRFNWLYKDNINGKAIFYCAYDGEILVGIEVHIPMIFCIAGKDILSALAVNSLTDDRYRGKGIWKNLLIFSQEEAAKLGFHIIWGVPNKESYPILLNKTKWKIVSDSSFEMFFLKAPKKSGIISYLVHSLLSIWPRIYFNDDLKLSFNELNPDIAIKPSAGVRPSSDYQYLKWRYLDAPGDNFEAVSVSYSDEILGYIVFTIIENVLFIADYSITTSEKINLAAIVYNIGRRYNCRKVNIRLNVKDLSLKSLKYGGSATRNKYKIFANILDPETEILIRNQNWNINFGDEDIRFIKTFRNSISGNYSVLKKIMLIDP